MGTYCEEKMILPKHMRHNKELSGKSYQEMRNELLQVENKISNAGDVGGLEEQKIKDETWKSKQEILMRYHRGCNTHGTCTTTLEETNTQSQHNRFFATKRV